MKITLKKLTLTNFKGIRHLAITFGHVINIFGDNATGKTSLFDAFLWLLFGKDSTNREDFEIKTLDENNQVFHKLDHEVEGVLVVDGNEITIRRHYKEKWTKKRGSTFDEFTGHATTFYWNDVPKSETEFKAKVAEIIDEKTFKLITNATYFNSLKWQDRRAVLMQLAGKISNSDVLDTIATFTSKSGIAALTAALNQGKSIEEFKKELAAKRKKIKDELDFMPTRIQEANRALPEEKDYTLIETQVQQLQVDISDVEGLLMNKSKAHKDHQDQISLLLKKRQGLSKELLDIEFSIKNQVQDRKREREGKIQNEKSQLRQQQNDLAIARKEYAAADARKKQLSEEQTSLRDKWAIVDGEKLEFKEGEFCCPACKREFPADDVEAKKEELTKNFNTDKSNRLKAITDRGQAIGPEVSDLDTKLANLKATGEKLNEEIATITNRIAELETEHSRLSADDEAEYDRTIATHQQYNHLKKGIELLDEQINTPYAAEDNSALLQRKRELNSQLDQLKTELASKGQREKQQDRIKELTDQETTMAQELAGFEGIENTVAQFTKAKMDLLQERINGRFKMVRFKMFEEQINEGEKETCTTLIKGVPYSDANTAAKIAAGLDIINVLNQHYDVYAPVWVDNRESVVRLPETSCQLINLIVSEPDKKLRIEAGKEELAMA